MVMNNITCVPPNITYVPLYSVRPYDGFFNFVCGLEEVIREMSKNSHLLPPRLLPPRLSTLEREILRKLSLNS